MMKRIVAALLTLIALSAPALAAGTVPGFSLSQQLDSNGTPLVGCRLYVVQAGTTSTPQNAYQDAALTLVLPNPIICDAYGRIPAFFVADGSIKLRLTKSNGVQVFSQDGILVVGASSGGGGGSPVDATTILATGDLKARYGTGVLTGFVRANGRTIGSATSGATERANADTQTLFEYLWDADANLTVSTGRGASAAADWSANKTIALPDWRGRALAFLDDMGNSAAGRLTSSYFGTSAIVLGAAGGSESTVLVTGNLPPYAPSGTVTGSTANTDAVLVNGNLAQNLGGGTTGFGWSNLPTIRQIQASNSWSGSFSGTAQGGSSQPLRTVLPTMLATIYVKL